MLFNPLLADILMWLSKPSCEREKRESKFSVEIGGDGKKKKKKVYPFV